MRWYKHLYVGEMAKRKRYPLISRIRYQKLQKDAYVITLPEHGKNLLDIYPSYVLLSSWMKKENLLIVGIACGKEEAMETAGRIIMETYRNTGTFEVSQYLQERR